MAAALLQEASFFPSLTQMCLEDTVGGPNVVIATEFKLL